MRLDLYLFEKGLAKSRSFAKTLVCDGFVSVNGKKQTKASLDISDGDIVEVTGKPYEYVGRGGLKLEAALNCFNVDVNGLTAVDIGASTGGFTHCLLLRGASKVFAVDIGHDQLDKSLVNDSRVVNIEGLNARYMTPEDVGKTVNIAVSDISFISQTYVIPVIPALLDENGIYIALIKPQFECGKSGLGKNGIVKDKKTRYEAVKKVVGCAFEYGLGINGFVKSPVEGGDGNTEYLAYFRKNSESTIDDKVIAEVCGV